MRSAPFLALVLAACALSNGPVEARFDVRVEDDERAPVAAAQLLVDGVAVAASDGAGSAIASVHASAARPASVSVRCPPGHSSPPPRRVPLAEGTRAYRLVLRCLPAERVLPVVVRAPGAEGAWVRADWLPLGRIEGDGTLHALLRRPPGSDVRLSIDTGGHPQITPQHPTRDVHVGNRAEIVVFDQPFTQREEHRVRRKVSGRPPAPRPYAIGPAH